VWVAVAVFAPRVVSPSRSLHRVGVAVTVVAPCGVAVVVAVVVPHGAAAAVIVVTSSLDTKEEVSRKKKKENVPAGRRGACSRERHGDAMHAGAGTARWGHLSASSRREVTTSHKFI